MRVLILDHFYDAFAAHWYAGHPGLASAPHEEQLRSFAASMFGGTAFEVDALRQLGVDAHLAIINTRESQEAWAKENGVPLTGRSQWRGRLRRGVVPWVDRVPDRRWVNQAILGQARNLRPDVIHIQCMDSIDVELLPQLRESTRLIVGQIAAPLPIERATAGYDLIVSSLPNFVERFRAAGIASEWLPLAFEPRLAQEITAGSRDVDVSFVGSVMGVHSQRRQLLDAVARRVPIDIWTADEAGLARGPHVGGRLHDPVWGRDMYRVLAASKITLNVHIDVAEQYANNLRLYEATGMGALLVTDEKVNLGELFEPGREVVTYESPQDCAEKVGYYLGNPAAAREIAEAGQRRTLRDHTWLDRMQRLVGIMEAGL